MEDGKKIYQIRIDGIDRSIDAVKSLVTQLDALEKKINELASKSVSVTANGTTAGNNTKALKQEEDLLKKIDQLHKKVADTEKKEYQELLHAKEELKEYQQIAKAIAAEANISSGVNNPNTMLGMKQQLHDIKAAMQVVDVDSDKFKQMQKQANDLNAKLLQIEKGYGQFGRNVGNYADGVAEGMQKIKIQVGDTTREFNSAREASRTLNNELKAMALNGQHDTQAYKDLNDAVKKVNSTIADTSRSSMMMDNLLDTMQGLTAIGTMGTSLSTLFGIEDKDYQESMNRMMALFALLKSIETLKLQWDSDEGWLFKPFKKLSAEMDKMGKDWGTKLGDNLYKAFDEKGYKPIQGLFRLLSKFRLSDSLEKQIERIQKLISNNPKRTTEQRDWALNQLNRIAFGNEGAGLESLDFYKKRFGKDFKDIEEVKKYLLNNLEAAEKFLYIFKVSLPKAITGLKAAFMGLSKVIMGVFSGAVLMILPELLNKIVSGVQNFIKSLDTTKLAADRATESLRALNKQLEVRRDLLSSSYLRGEISSEEYLRGIYQAQREALIAQNEELKKRAAAFKQGTSGWNLLNPFSKNRFNGSQNLEYTGNRINENGTTVGAGNLLGMNKNDLQITIKSVDELTDAWQKCNEAIENGQDYFTRWGEGFSGWFNSLFATAKDTEKVMRGLGNVGLGDFISRFDEVNKKFHYAEISAQDYAKEIAKLKAEMNDNKMLNSVIMNLDKYIPDEGVRNAIQNIINELVRLDDAFNMTSPEQVHYWNQVRIDAMKDGLQKELAQIQENERYEIQQKAYTEEQKTLLEKKYERQRQNARDKANKDALSKAKEHGKKLKDAENELIALRIENMKNGLDKEIAQIENERRLAIQKARESGTKSGDIIMQINIKYDQKILEQKRKWAADVIKIYEDMLARIEQVNKQTFEIEVETATQNTEMKQSEALRKSGYEMITPSTYDDTKALEAYYKKVMDIEKKYLDIQAQIQRESLEKQLDYTKAEEELRHRRATDPNDNEFLQQLNAGKITQEQYDKLIEDENTAHAARMNAIDKKYASDLKKITEENLQETQALYERYFENIINGLRNDKAKIDEIASKPPVTDKNGWDVVNIGKTSANYKKALADYDKLKNDIIAKQSELDAALKANQISPEDFAMKKSELDSEMKAINQSVQEVGESQKMLVANFVQSIQPYIQAAVQSFNTIMQAVWDAQDAAFDKEQESLDKELEEIETKLEKQKELTEKYKNDIESIEDELANSRGDRRQHLIDQLNAEIAAQRASWAEEKRIEKEREKTQQKQDELDNKRKKAQYKRDMMQAIVNGAMAVTMAAINKWPIPAIPMMALAASTTAAQLAIMASHKPYYADGGVLKGRSHKQGGIPLLNGQAEAEGGEYITNKRTTAKNVDLLDYINSKKKRLDLSDMVEFFNNKARANVKTISKTYLADGGIVSYSTPEINANDNIRDMLRAYGEKPIYVEVKEILNKADDIRHVQVLSGKINPSSI